MACHSPKPAATAPQASHTAASQPDNNGLIREIRFESSTRGYQKKVVFTPDSLFIVIQSMTVPDPKIKQQLSPGQWQQLTASLSGMELGEISKLESPTHGRETDAAKLSTITVYTDNKTYAHMFDDTNPNVKLQPLMTVISTLEKSAMAK